MDCIRQFLYLTVVISMSLNSLAVPRKVDDHKRKLAILPSSDVCGKETPYYERSIIRRVIGGNFVKPGQLPWMASIGYTNESLQNPQWLCTGSLITDQYVITAAHCLIKEITHLDISVVRLGDLDLNSLVADGATHKDFQIEKTIPHEHFHYQHKENDIGLIKLSRKVDFGESIRPICLPPVDFLKNLYVDHHPTVAGWQTMINGVKNTKLTKEYVEIISTEDCQHRYGRAAIDDTMICATSPETNICQGYSGAPLMMFLDEGDKGRVHLMGIVSHGFNCTSNMYPRVYMRVAKYMEWIVDNLDI